MALAPHFFRASHFLFPNLFVNLISPRYRSMLGAALLMFGVGAIYGA